MPFQLTATRCASALCTFFLALCLALPAQADVSKRELDKSKHQGIKTIALLVAPERTKVIIMNQGGGAALFGLIGGAARASTDSQNTKEFTRRLIESDVKLAASFRNEVKANLEKTGFDVVVVNDWPKSVDGKDDYSHIKTDADVILCAWIGFVGYISPPDTKEYQPWMTLNARLLDPKTQGELYKQSFIAGKKHKSEGFEHVPLPDPKFRFASFDQMMERFDDALGGLTLGQQQAAVIVARQLAVGLRSAPQAPPAAAPAAAASAPHGESEKSVP